MALRLFLALALVATAQARLMHDEGISSPKRSLLVSAICPEGCNKAAGGCVQDATTAGLRCQQCLGNLVVNKATGLCTCPAGKYSNGTYTTCSDCPKGSYCIGGVWTATFANAPMPVSCNPSMTTIGLRSTSNRACVNQPGTYYVLSDDGNATATTCPVNTYGAGLKKQRACVPCPTGYTTDGLTGKSSPTACKVPAGYYLKAPGQVAPCPKGEWKSGVGTNASCTKCALGVTTKLEASISQDNCTDVLPGYYAFNISSGIVLDARVCPQKFYCPGGTPAGVWTVPGDETTIPAGDTTVKVCPNQMWTIDIGATSIDQCLTPPGYYTANGLTVQCTGGIDGTYRADWKPAGQATACKPCGDNVYADRTDLVTVYDPITYNASTISITTSADDCYIKPGQGLYYSTITGSWRAKNCEDNNYGVPNTTYGLTPAACKDCPAGMYASNDVTTSPNSAAWWLNDTDGAGGFVSPQACVTYAGYGYNGRIAQLCDKGWWNPADTRSTCTECPFGYTTADVGVGVANTSCGIAAGFGLWYQNGTGLMAVVPCPIGYYNDVNYTSDPLANCTACPDHTTTEKEGSDAANQCNLCSAGYGGALCGTQCGGLAGNATYGPPGRSLNSSCSSCSTMTTGYSFEFNLTNTLYVPKALSRPGANASTDCVAQFTQVNDGTWYLNVTNDTAAGFTKTSNVATFDACVDLCAAATNCMFMTYDYYAQTCIIRVNDQNGFNDGDAWVAFKAAPSGDTAMQAWKKKKNNAGAKTVSSGQYTWYQDSAGGLFLPKSTVTDLGFGTWSAITGSGSFTTVQDCLNACDDDGLCAGIGFNVAVDVALVPDEPTTAAGCMMLKGNKELGEFQRSMTRATVTHMVAPTWLQLSDPSGNAYPTP